MDARLLGWAGTQLRAGDHHLVIDPLADAGAVWGWAGERAAGVPLPPVVAAEPAGAASIGLLTHLHRDHADAEALSGALAPDATVFLPAPYPRRSGVEELATAGAAAELERAGLRTQAVSTWDTIALDGWTITALPAADGTGDPQHSWLVERDGLAVVHAGDTLPHGWWWRIAEWASDPITHAFLPVNGARLALPNRRPASPLRGAMEPEDAVVAAQLLGAALVPIHHGAYAFPPVYVPVEDPLGRVAAAAEQRGVRVVLPELGAWFGLRAPVAA